MSEKKLPKTKMGNNYLNFIASHDGIGMRPVEGYLKKEKLSLFFKRLKKNGGQLSYRKVQGSSKKVYEANITLFNAFKKTDYDKKGKFFFERYISAHAIMIAFEGVPAIYFNSLFGTSNDEYKYIISGNKRDLNRYKWNKNRLDNLLKDKSSKQNIFYKKILNLIFIKNQSKALEYYNTFRKLKSIAEPNYDFSNISVDFFNGMGRMYKMRYENDKINSKNLLDSCISYFSKSLDLNPKQYTPNYDLGILYHNLGVDIILEELDIDADLEMVILMQEQAVEYFSKSLPYLEKVYQMKPEETSIVQGIAAVYYSLNDMEKHVEYMNILKGLQSKSSGDN